MRYITTEESARQPYEEVAARLQTDPRAGLSWKEAEFRQRICGYNEFIVKHEEPLWQKYLEQVCVPIGIFPFSKAIFHVSIFPLFL